MEEQNRSTELEVEDMHPDRAHNSLSGTWLCCMPCYWLQRNNRVEKTMLTVITLLVSVLLVASPVIFLMSNAPADRSSPCSQDCWTRTRRDCSEEECITEGQRLSEALLHDRHPCKDFHLFVCGTSTADSNQKPYVTYEESLILDTKHQLAVAANSQPFQKLGAFFKSCLRAEDTRFTYTPMMSLIKELGGYVAPNAVPPCDLTTLLYRLMRVRGTPLFEIAQQHDASNVKRRIPVIDVPKEYLQWHNMGGAKLEADRDGGEQNRMKEMRKLVMKEILKQMIPESIVYTVKKKEINDSIFFAAEVAGKLLKSREAVEENIIEPIPVLQERYTFVQWRLLLQLLFQSEFSSEHMVKNLCPSYLDELNALLKGFEHRVIHNGLLVMFATDVLYPLVNTSVHLEWPTFCTQTMAQLFQEPVTAILVKKYSDDELQTFQLEISSMMSGLKHTLEAQLSNTTLLENKFRIELIREIENLQTHIQPFDKYRNDTYIFSLLNEVRVDPQDFLGNTIRRYAQLPPLSFNVLSEISGRLFIPSHRSALQWSPIYDSTQNQIVVPIALLLHPLMKQNLPRYLSYSSVGQILSTTLLQIILSYAKKNVQVHAGPILKEKFKCLTQQMSGENSEVANNVKIEELASARAVDVAYRAWAREENSQYQPGLPQVKFNNNQLFLILSTQVHCSANHHNAIQPSPHSVISIIINYGYFSTAFNCSGTSLMNSRHRCSLW